MALKLYIYISFLNFLRNGDIEDAILNIVYKYNYNYNYST